MVDDAVRLPGNPLRPFARMRGPRVHTLANTMDAAASLEGMEMFHAATRKIVAAGALVALAACGAENEGRAGADGAGGDGGGGEAIGRMQGEITGNTGGASLVAPHVGLIWARFDETRDSEPVYSTDAAPIAGDATSFTLPIFNAPPAAQLSDVDFDMDGDPDARLAFGSIFAFEDLDGDGTTVIGENGVGAPDRIFGISWRQMVLYVDEVHDAAVVGEFFGQLTEGTLYVVDLDFCDGTLALTPPPAVVELFTFTPGQDVPEDELPVDDYVCIPPDAGGVCTDPDAVECTDCIADAQACTEACNPVGDAYVACVETNCS